jgi:TM2 domain-containing membrane protein YozV
MKHVIFVRFTEDKEISMKHNPFIAGILSLLVPGLGQIYGGAGNKGAATIAAAIVIGNLNIIILPLISIANPAAPTADQKARAIWAYWIPRVMHDVISLWSITFWIWAIADAISIARQRK